MPAQTWALVNAHAGAGAAAVLLHDARRRSDERATSCTPAPKAFYKSVDGGKTLTTMRTPHGDNHDIWINPKDGNVMIQSNDGGANVSTDGGRTWSTQMNQLTGEFYARVARQRSSRTRSTARSRTTAR